ncbi:hypothetical protein E5357_12005 [Hominisplanchenecus murintestinalis]|uniref:Uncharacterized protein n=1 Tax=Hominisplanchenecus murintestinalis TaxID=2941517 RepID=A0AC61QX80_9FIRM|nr:hypothetical protein [Hominisplanchenecus murintestinalis]TGX97554.1 hypothetical protein E5357_12005 [Hominisplanchenecus murintestinalis]
MGTWILIFLISGALFYYMYQRHKKLVDSGKVIDRESNFVEKAEDFIISQGVPDEVQKQIQTLPYAEMKVSMRTEGGGQSFLFTGSTWSARLYRKNDEAGKTIYSFQYLNWKTHNGGIMYEDYMNMLLTSIEKMFLSIDPDTQVKTRLLETKTSHKFF